MPYYHDVNPVDAMPPADEWKPAYWTPMKSERSLGNDMVQFIEHFVTPPRTMSDADFEVLAWQKWLLNHIFELNEDGFLRYNKIYFQVPRKNGKSFLASSIMLYFLFKAQGGEQLFAVARDSKQARYVYDETLAQIHSSKLLQKVLKPGQNVITNKRVRASFAPLSGNSGSAMGLAPYGAIGDEIHKWDSLTGTSNRGADMYAALTTGSRDRPEWFFLGITTAGDNDQGLAHTLYDYGKMVATGDIEDDRFGFFCWEAEEEDDIYSPETWKKANPNLQAGLMKEEDFAAELKTAEATSTADFERYALNKWLRSGDKADFISGFHWKNALKPELGKIPKGAEICVGFDGALTEDSTGIVAIDINTGLIEVLYGWEKDPLNADWFVDVDEVEKAMDQVINDYVVVKAYCDPSRHQTTVQKWARTYGRGIFRDIPPSSSRMSSMSQEFKGDVYTGHLFHVGERRLTNHTRNAIETLKGVPNKDKRNSPRKIDFLAAAVLANGARHEIIARRTKKSGISAF